MCVHKNQFNRPKQTEISETYVAQIHRYAEKFLLNLGMQMDHLILVRRPALVLINKKNFVLVNFAVQTDNKVK